MHQPRIHSDEEIIAVYQRHIDMVFRISYSYLKNIADSEDAVSMTFIKYMNNDIVFHSIEHEKAWFIVTCTHVCKDMLKQRWRRHISFDENHIVKLETFQIDQTLEAILKLPARYKTVIYMYYYVGYNSEEIAEILHKPSSTIRNQLARAKKILKRKLGDLTL